MLLELLGELLGKKEIYWKVFYGNSIDVLQAELRNIF